MKAGKRVLLGGLLCWLLATLCWYMAQGAWVTHQQWWQTDILRFRSLEGEQDFSSMTALRSLMGGQEGAKVSAWAAGPAQTLQVTGTGASLSSDVLWVDGDLDLLMQLALLRGEPLREGNRRACVLDQKAAMQLFGSLDVLGQTVEVDGKPWTVTGVAHLPEGISFTGSDPGRSLVFATADQAPASTALSEMAFVLPGLSLENGEAQAQEWSRNVGLTLPDAEGGETDHALMPFLVQLPGYCLLALLLVVLVKTMVQACQSCIPAIRGILADRRIEARTVFRPVMQLSLTLLLCFVAALGLCLLPMGKGTLPASMLPTRWSDFAFWPSLLRRLAQQGAQSKLSASLRTALLGEQLRNLCLGCTGLSIAFYLAAYLRLSHKELRLRPAAYGAVGLFACVVQPLCLVFVRSSGLLPHAAALSPVLPVVMIFAALMLHKKGIAVALIPSGDALPILKRPRKEVAARKYSHPLPTAPRNAHNP